MYWSAIFRQLIQTPLLDIIQIFKQDNPDPLDGDEVDTLVEHLRNAINLQEGNITEPEYYEKEKKLWRR